MRRFRTYLYLALVLVGVSASCGKEEPIFEGYDTTVDLEGENRSISFNINHIWKELLEGEQDINICLTGLYGNSRVINLAAVISRKSEISSRITMMMSARESIPDGSYQLNVSRRNWQSRESFIVMFKEHRIRMITAEQDYYSQLPYDADACCYEISSTTNFKQFLSGLSKDPNNGAGKKFLQTTDIDWDELKTSLSAGLEKRVPFAGCYDGGNNKIINVSYKGNGSAEDDIDVGIFSILKNGAEIRNLTIHNGLSFTDIHSYGGLIAGKAEGTVKLTDLTVTGSFNCNKTDKSDYIGGLIGCVRNADLTISGITLNLEMSNLGGYIGGLVGCLENSKADISKVYTPNFEIDIYAESDAGGFIGAVRNSSFNIRTSALNHAATAEMPDYFKIEVSDKNVGGAIGSIESLSDSSSFSEVDIRVPVGAALKDADIRNAGGLIGYAVISKTLTLNNSLIGACVGGGSNVGGFIGYCSTTDNNCLKFSGYSIISPQKGSEVEITGKNYIGGFIGYLNGNQKEMEFNGKDKLIANVSGNGDCVGGYIGYINEAKIRFSSETESLIDPMAVISSTGNYVGGFSGYGVKTTVKGNNRSFDFTNGIPKYDTFTTNICCTVKGGKYVGGLFGYVSECSISDIAVKTTVTGGEYTGGIFGYVHFHWDVEINRCVHSGTVTGTANNTGGISGYCRNNGKLQYCINFGTVKGKDNCGGVVGKVDYFEQPPYVHYCVNVGDVSGTGDVGGVVGFMDGQQDCGSWTKIQRCANYGSVYSSGGGSNGVGGILGRCKQRHGKVLNCANHGSVDGSAQQAGGIVGWMGRDPAGVYQSANLEIGYCANFGRVNSSNSNAYVGGISGYDEEGAEGAFGHSHLHACYNCGEIPSNPEKDTGGLLGYADHYAAVEDCINFGKVHNGNVAVGTRKALAIIDVVDVYYLDGTGDTWMVDKEQKFTEGEMGTQDKFKGLNWSGHWEMGYSVRYPDNKHPVLKDCPFQNISWTN